MDGSLDEWIEAWESVWKSGWKPGRLDWSIDTLVGSSRRNLIICLTTNSISAGGQLMCSRPHNPMQLRTYSVYFCFKLSIQHSSLPLVVGKPLPGAAIS